MASSEKRARSFQRVLHVRGRQWRYKVGGDAVFILSPLGETFHVRIHTLQGCDFYSLERDQLKGTWTGVRPSEVKAWIEKNLDPRACVV